MCNQRDWIFILLCTGCVIVHAGAQISANYSLFKLAGFNVLVEKNAFIHDKNLTGRAMKMLESQLVKISKLPISKAKMDSLKTVPIFVDWRTTNGGAQYHPGREWLENNGYAVEKAKCVEISNIRNFVNWSRQNQPYMVLHELAHAYHHRINTGLKSLVANTYQHAMSSNLYSHTLYHEGNGKKRTAEWAYAAKDEKEYFAELTEAYFGINDYFPFDREDLAKYDTAGFNMMMSIWSDLQND